MIRRGVRIYRLSHLRVGMNVLMDEGAVCDCGRYVACGAEGGITIGNECYIGYNAVLLGGGGIEIGNKVLIAPGVVITSRGHEYRKRGLCIKDQHLYLAKVSIADDVWIGANASILPGITIGKGSIIGAGAVVTRDIPVYSVAAGVPAKVIGVRK